MSTKNLSRPEILPSLKAGGGSKRNCYFSAANSPSKMDSMVETHDPEKLHSNRGGIKKQAYNTFNFSHIQLRTTSLATPLDYTRKGIVFPETSATPSQLRKEDGVKRMIMMEKIAELKISLNRYQDTSDGPIIPTRTDVRKIIKCLEGLNDESSELTELMTIVVKVLKTALFANWRMIEPFIEKLHEDCSEELRTVLQSCKKDATPYYALCIALLRDVASEKKNDLKMDRHAQQIEQMQEIIEEKENIIRDLDRQLKERITTQDHKKLLEDIEFYRETCSEQSKENQNLRNQYSDALEDNASLRKQVDNEAAEIDRHLLEIQILEKEKVDIIKETEESRKQIRLMKEKIKGFKDIMDKIIVKLGNVKQQVLDLRHENEELLYQNEKLSLRAARGFDALTPRPDYRKLQEEKKLELDVYDKTGRRQIMPTIKIMEELTMRLHAAADKNKEGLNKKKDKLGLPKLQATNSVKSPTTQSNRRPSLTQQQPPKPRPSLLESQSPQGQKSFFAKDVSFQSGTGTNNSPRHGAGPNLAPGEPTFKDMKASSGNNFANEESVSNKEEESQYTEQDETLANQTLNKSVSQVRNALANMLTKSDSLPKKEEKTEPLFGDETVKQANNLINFVVETKKAIDKLD